MSAQSTASVKQERAHEAQERAPGGHDSSGVALLNRPQRVGRSRNICLDSQ